MARVAEGGVARGGCGSNQESANFVITSQRQSTLSEVSAPVLLFPFIYLYFFIYNFEIIKKFTDNFDTHR